jgi:hypothetical protein
MRPTTPRQAWIVSVLTDDIYSLGCPYCGQTYMYSPDEVRAFRGHSRPCHSCRALAMVPDATRLLAPTVDQRISDDETPDLAPVHPHTSGDLAARMKS